MAEFDPKSKPLKLCMTGGGSGGHVMPAIALLEYLNFLGEKSGIDPQILYVGSYFGLEKNLLEPFKIQFESISTGKLRRYLSFENVKDIFKVLLGFFQAWRLLKKYQPEVVLSFGGFVSVPVVLAAFIKGIPCVVHEQTVNVGLANRIAGYVAGKIALSFPSSAEFFPKSKTVLTGLPMRLSLKSPAPPLSEFFPDFQNLENLSLIYVTGGGQGSVPINKVLLETLETLLKDYKVIHQVGQGKLAEPVRLKNSLPGELQKRYQVCEFLKDELPAVLQNTRLLIGRSGAGIVNECWQLKIPALFIPLPFATKNEQFLNAQFLQEQNQALILEQKNLSPAILLQKIDEALQIPFKKENKNSSPFENEVAQKILNLCLEVRKPA